MYTIFNGNTALQFWNMEETWQLFWQQKMRLQCMTSDLKKKKKSLSPWLLNANKKDLSEWGDWVTVSFSMTKSRTDRTQICTYHWGFIFCPSRGGNLYYYMSKKTLYQRNRILKKNDNISYTLKTTN